MTRMTALAAAVLTTVAFDVEAQDGLRSASLPERPVATTPPPANNPYTANADTYTKLRPNFPPIALPIIGYDGVYVHDAWRHPAPRMPRAEADPQVGARAQRTTSTPVPMTVPAAPVVKARPKTFYVIPGCYAGDTRPQPTTAPACDLSQLRVIPPR